MEFEVPDPVRDKELGRFLRDRRARLTPQAIGLAPGERRRTPGLRREEVAQLANISTTWYTWLEQGRGIRPSLSVLEALARTLRLGPDEHGHLLALCGYTDVLVPHPAAEVLVPEAVQTMLDALNPVPAYVLNLRCDILAWNDAQRAFMADFSQLPADERNALWLWLNHPALRRMVLNWSANADALVARWRGIAVPHAGRADIEDMVTRMNSSSAEFRDRWNRLEIRNTSAVKIFDHPRVGRVDVQVVVLEILEMPETFLVSYTPADPVSASRLPLLLETDRPGFQ